MGQWTNSNIRRTVSDGPFCHANMSRCTYDPKKKNPYWQATLRLSPTPHLEEIPISGWFITQLDICIVCQTPQIYSKPIQTLYHRMEPASPLQLSLTVERSVKHHRWPVWIFFYDQIPQFARQIPHQSLFNSWICPLSHQSPQRFKQMQFKWNFLWTLWIWG